jgi:hypothetical protein
MTPTYEILSLFVLPIPIACIAWTVTHEDLFREFHDWCAGKSTSSKRLLTRKFFYLFTCEYCFSHYVVAGFLIITHFTLLFDGWRGYLISGFSLVWLANVYMGLFGWLRLEVREDRIEIAAAERQADVPPGTDRRTHHIGPGRGRAPRDGTM